jgi:hypothetical protein
MRIAQIIDNKNTIPTWDIEVPEYHYYLLKNGCVSHNSISSSFPEPCLSSGIEPTIAPAYWRKTRAINKGVYTYYFVIPKRIQEYVLSILDPASEDYAKLAAFPGSELDEDGKIGIIDRKLATITTVESVSIESVKQSIEELEQEANNLQKYYSNLHSILL